jgi:hypothetical protein
MGWKQQGSVLSAWLKTTPPASIGAKLFLQTRFGVRSASPFVPGQNFGLAFDEKRTAPVVRTGAVEAHGGEPFKRAD